MGGGKNRWLLTGLAGTGPDTKTPRIWTRKRQRGKWAGCPWKAPVLTLLLLGVLHLINDSVQDGLSCRNLSPFTGASSFPLLALLFLGLIPVSPSPNLGANHWSRMNWVFPWKGQGRLDVTPCTRLPGEGLRSHHKRGELRFKAYLGPRLPDSLDSSVNFVLNNYCCFQRTVLALRYLPQK